MILNNPRRLVLFITTVILVVMLGVLWINRPGGRRSLAKYKTELRAKGEKLSAEELGYPKPPENSSELVQLLAAASRVGKVRFQPSILNHMPFTGPAQAELMWASPEPFLHGSSGTPSATNKWEAITAQFASESNITIELREAVKTSPRYFYNDPTNFAARPNSPFVGIRAAAQWLGADAVVALRERRVDDAALDIHALAQLTQFHREDHTLVSQMIRVAIAGLGLSVTWQALQAEGWNEELLAGLQKDWEAANFADSFETAMVGERAFGESAFAMMRVANSRERMGFLRLSMSANPVRLKTPKDYFEAYVIMPFWAANSDVDEMFFLQHLQRNLESVRKLRSGVPWSQINAELNSNYVALNQAFSSPMAKYRYLFSAIAIPNSLKAAGVCVKTETQRRMTVAVIALERYKLQVGAYPPDLGSLVPQFLSAVPTDLMSMKPLCYRLNPDRTFTLYSVGEDGHDDGGDATSGSVTNGFDWWTGRDGVWPVAVRNN